MKEEINFKIIEKENFTKAVECLKRVVELEPDNFNA